MVVGDFNARVGTYQNVEVDDNVMVLDLTCDSEDCTKSNYSRLLILMLKCINLHILNGTDAILMACFDWIPKLKHELIFILLYCNDVFLI